ncbi:MAG: hypothetical protein K6B65_03405 [Bacilli bacterium]|nr:hypothetical protein [Bacilli bacterium]
MELRIKDIAWGIDRRNGERKESEVADMTFDLVKEGPLPPVGPSRHVFIVEKIDEDRISIRLSSKKEPVTIKRKERYEYRPTSFDGGHRYILEVR